MVIREYNKCFGAECHRSECRLLRVSLGQVSPVMNIFGSCMLQESLVSEYVVLVSHVTRVPATVFCTGLI